MGNSKICTGKHQVIGFLRTCLLCEAADEKEVEKSLEPLISATDDIELISNYVVVLEKTHDRFELLNAFDELTDVYWTCPLSGSQIYALTGITYARGIIPYEHTPASEKTSRAALQRHPEIEKIFREVFPFIDF